MQQDTLAWLQEITGEVTLRAIAKRVGRAHSTIHRWVNDGIPPDAVIEIALRADADVIAAMVAAGWMSADEVEAINLDDTIKVLPITKLTGEIHRRAQAHAFRTRPTTGASPR